ncbi:putative methyltransferase C9orf114 homolog [Diadema antillarum]|uniref:putative methyltransferase C9orf114 homolog n=1 Tax=Diadema antillarum TaxID=105358 RepID=UPI003A87532C
MSTLRHSLTLEEAMELIRSYEKDAKSKFAVTSHSNYCGNGEFGQPVGTEELMRHKVVFEELPLNGTPHIVLGIKTLSCQHGPKQKRDMNKSEISANEEQSEKQNSWNSKKFGCGSNITLHSAWVFPEYKMPSDTVQSRKKISKKIKAQLEAGKLCGELRFYVNLPDPQSLPKHLKEQATEWKSWKEEIKEKKKKKREKKLLKLLEQQRAMSEEQNSSMEANDVEKDSMQNDQGRPWTISVALPGSILDNAQSPELRTYLAGQIARALVVFNVDEVIIFDESGSPASQNTDGVFSGVGKKGNANVQLARLLQYLECPQYLRKSFFPRHSDLQYAGLLNPLDSPHHVRATEDVAYREGIVVDRPVAKGRGSLVNVGLLKEVHIDRKLQPGLRVTVQMNKAKGSQMRAPCKVVSPSAPRIQSGLYWGYTVRLASSLGAVFTGCPFSDGGYDLTIGTSERGANIDDAALPEFKHAIVVFGGVQGLEFSLEVDQALVVSDPSLLFDLYLNTCPNQGSRTIRTEEAILITMSALRPKLLSVQAVGR